MSNEWEGIWKEATNLSTITYFENINGIKKNAETLLSASKNADPDVNVEKSK
jgi:hypothetical protein